MDLAIFIEISAILAIASAVAVIMRILRQPMIIGYIITGLIVGPYFFGIVKSPEVIHSFAELGIAFLLFVVGLNLSPRIIKEVGWVSLIAGMGQVLFTSIIGYILARVLGFNAITGLYLAIGLTLSSTIVVLKLLYDKNSLNTLYGKITVGILIFQDIVASIAIIISSSFAPGSASVEWYNILLVFAQTVVFIVALIFIAKIIMKFLGPLFVHSQEFLFIFTLGWGLSISSVFYISGLSIEIGALAAGISLAMFPYHKEMSARMRPLRDFFLILFFVSLGSQISVYNIREIFSPAIIFSFFVLVGNPIIVMIIMGYLGYRKRTSFFSGVSIAQVSSFSFILVALGVRNGHIDQSVLSLMTLVGIITIAASSYLIVYAEKIYGHIKKSLKIFERKETIENQGNHEFKDDVILFGCNRIGEDFLYAFREEGINVFVIDIDPQIIFRLREKNISAQYGDAGDVEFLDLIDFSNVKMVVSTIPDFDINELLIQKVKEVNKNAILLVVAHQIDEANNLYNMGADYVIMPYFLGGSYASNMITHYKFSREGFAYEKKKHVAYLEEKKKKGHEHPPLERFML